LGLWNFLYRHRIVVAVAFVVRGQVEVEEAAKAAANTNQRSRMRLDRFLVIGGE